MKGEKNSGGECAEKRERGLLSPWLAKVSTGTDLILASGWIFQFFIIRFFWSGWWSSSCEFAYFLLVTTLLDTVILKRIKGQFFGVDFQIFWLSYSWWTRYSFFLCFIWLLVVFSLFDQLFLTSVPMPMIHPRNYPRNSPTKPERIRERGFQAGPESLENCPATSNNRRKSPTIPMGALTSRKRFPTNLEAEHRRLKAFVALLNTRRVLATTF